MSSQSELTWAQRASRQKVGRFLQPNKRRLDNPTDVPLVGIVLYEDDDLKGQILASKAMAIIQQSLSSGSVLFTFQKTLFPDRVAAYKVIQDQISPDVEFRPLSLFAQVEHAQVAMREGVTVQGVVYKASTSKESAEFGDVKHVRFTLMRMVDKTTFLSDLMESLSYFGKVLQVKKFTHRGYFEGKLSVILDTSVGFQEVQSANFTKKHKVHHHSEDSEDVTLARKNTVELMEYIEKEKLGVGKEVEKVEEEELDYRVVEDESLQGESVDESENDESTGNEDLDLLSEDNHQVSMNDDEDMEDDKIVLAGAPKKLDTVRGSAYSKYASAEVAVNMNIDSPEEMLNLTKLKDLAQRKRMEFNANLKGTTGAGVKGDNKLGNSGGVSSGTGAKGNKSGVASGVASGGVSGGVSGVVKNSKTNGRALLKTKQDAP
ncbi:uncharacterized protein ATC70_000078 [Mucor velutinosus]|uniref:Uncharacterized protein n=1 Tax=Mucor velutinosus TaxID=708070 RepID=A0AAN7DE23_9FUNG|nr:hypothetical protein ATC70_000078 [Mucor velutinosus]